MIIITTNPREARYLSSVDALFRSMHGLGAAPRSSPGALRHPQVAVPSTTPQVDARTRIAGLCEDLGFSPGDPACVGLRTSSVGAAHAAANISDWLTYLPRDCVRAMVKEGWHWTA